MTSLDDARDLDLYEIAYLSGGPERVVDTAVVALVVARRVRVCSPGLLGVVDLSRRHPVEGAVLDAVGSTGHRSVAMVCWRLVGDDRLLDIGRGLHRAGLLGRFGAAVAVLHGDHRGLAPTHAGRKVLREHAAWSSGDSETHRVAVGGPDGMADSRLAAEIFGRSTGPSSSPEDRIRRKAGAFGASLPSWDPPL